MLWKRYGVVECCGCSSINWIHQLQVLFHIWNFRSSRKTTIATNPDLLFCNYKLNWLQLQKSIHRTELTFEETQNWEVQVPDSSLPGTRRLFSASERFSSRSQLILRLAPSSAWASWGFHSFHADSTHDVFQRWFNRSPFFGRRIAHTNLLFLFILQDMARVSPVPSWHHSCTSKRSSANFAMVRQPQRKVIEKFWINDCWLVWQYVRIPPGKVDVQDWC